MTDVAGNTNSIMLVIYLGVGKMHESKVFITVTSCSNCKINSKD